MCLDDQMLSEYIDDELTEPWKSQVMEHLEWCESCKSRYNELESLKKSMAKASLDDDVISSSQSRVLRYLDSNVIGKSRHRILQSIGNFFNKKILVPACAVAITFCFCLIIFNSPKENDIIVAQDNVPSLSLDNVIQVRSSDNYTTSQTLSDYSLEEILQYLDDSGYDVTLRNKSVSAVEFSQSEKEFASKTITPENQGFTLPSNGFPFTFNFPF